MRNLLARMEQAVDTARDRRQGVPPLTAGSIPAVPVQPVNGTAPVMERRPAETAPAPIPFPAAAPSGKPKARAKSLEEFDAAFKRLAERQAG
ncbi:MAG: hypothetical protein FJ253_04040 [Phycisphaerae bacterium]|nr:hypothetical protein [Phycisphaerae bacterium]